MQVNITLPALLRTIQEAGNLNNSLKMLHNPNNRQPHHTVNSSKKKDTADNWQSCQPIATSCKDRSPTPHPCGCDNTAHNHMNRGKENTKKSLPMDITPF